ncbi:MAG TPA: potassium channel family protein [Byssovorax sp.]|jgi:hypothetical protein
MNPRPLLALAALAAVSTPGTMEDLAREIRSFVNREPTTSVIGTVAGAAYLFYRAEFGKNPKVKSYYDALVYVSTCLSVGYGDIFAQTDAGKLIGTALMTYGPALSGKILDEPVLAPPARRV